MEFLLSLDQQVFFFINHLPHTQGTDFVAQVLSGFGYAWILWLMIGVILIYKEEKKDHHFWIPMGIAAGLCYLISEVMLKNCVGRLRPDILTNAIVVGFHPISYSFPSTHAVVGFAFAYLFSVKEPKMKLFFYPLAVFVGLSRIYLGHHYPIDVLAGGVTGICIGLYVVYLTKTIVPNRSRQRIRKR